MSNLRLHTAILAGVAVVLPLLVGCGGPARAQVTGTVTLDGQPLETGMISFEPIGGDGQSAGGGIKDGRYTLDASPGEMRVAIRANKVVGKTKLYNTPDSPTIDKVEEIIPARYYAPSELKVTLKPGSNENVNFELTTKKK